MKQIVYASFAVSTDHETVESILRVSKENNKNLNVTGLLILYGGVYLQLLEGDRSVVEELFNKIESDKRHSKVVILHENESDTEARLCPNWSMEFKDFGDGESQHVDIDMANRLLFWHRKVMPHENLLNSEEVMALCDTIVEKMKSTPGSDSSEDKAS